MVIKSIKNVILNYITNISKKIGSRLLEILSISKISV